MANTFPAYAPGAFATSQLQYGVLLNDLNANDPAVLPSLHKKYGNENYSLIMQLLGRSVMEARVDNKQFSHYEDRNLHSSVRVNAAVTGTAAGAAATFTVHSSDHYSSGTKSPIRVGEVGILASSGIQAQITAINTTTPSAHTFTIKPLNSADQLTSAGSAAGTVAAGELFLFRGAVNIGEGSSKISGLAPMWDKITNTTTEHRDDFPISDVANMEKQIIQLANGSPYYYNKALDSMNRRFLNNEFFKVMEGVSVNNITGTYGTVGVIPRVAANGTTIQYTAGSLTLADIQTLTRALNNYGAPGEYHALMDNYTKQAFNTLLFGTFATTNGAVTYKSVGGSKEAGAGYGFDTFRMDGITFHAFSNPMFNTEQVYKRTPTLSADYYRNFCLLVPQADRVDPKDGQVRPAMQLVHQYTEDGTKILTFETGGLAKQNKTTTMEKNVTMISYPGMRVIGASQFGILKGV